MGKKDEAAKAAKRRKQESELDEALAGTFPASDPLSMTSPEVGPGTPPEHVKSGQKDGKPRKPAKG